MSFWNGNGYLTPSSIRHARLRRRKGRRGVHIRWNDPRELPSLEQFPSFAPSAGHFDFVVLIVCSLPRLVSTRIRSRSPTDAMKPSTWSSSASLMRITPFPGPDR